MANVLNRATKQFIRSVNTPDYDPAAWIINPDVSKVVGVPTKYWDIQGNTVSEMDAAEKALVDKAESDAQAAIPDPAEKRIKDLEAQVSALTEQSGKVVTALKDASIAVEEVAIPIKPKSQLEEPLEG